MPIDTFYDDMRNKRPKLESIKSNAQELPSFLRFNTDNRTIYGLLEARHLIDNIYRFDFVYIDD